MATDRRLWSSTAPVRTLCAALGVRTHRTRKSFRGWSRLPDRALLAIKWDLEGGKPFWHWVVFVREKGRPYVMDSKASLRRHVRTDFGRMKPKWYIAVAGGRSRLSR